jgi:hypothetical protein
LEGQPDVVKLEIDLTAGLIEFWQCKMSHCEKIVVAGPRTHMAANLSLEKGS